MIKIADIKKPKPATTTPKPVANGVRGKTSAGVRG